MTAQTKTASNQPLRDQDSTVPMIERQIQMETAYSKYQAVPAIRRFFEQLGFEQPIEAIGLPLDFGMDLLIQMSLHKRAAPEVIIGLLVKHTAGDAQVCADMLELAVNEGMVTWMPDDGPFGRLVVKYDISDELQEYIETLQYPLPMIVEPCEVTRNRETGYHTIKKSLILRDNHHEDDICLDHINRVNRQRLKVNARIADMIQNTWKDLDHRKEDESIEDYHKRVRAFDRFDTVSRDVVNAMSQEEGPIYLTHSYDKRGRTYANGYHVTTQGNDWCKASLEFFDAEPLKE